MLALYMAWAIGANDVANAMGTSLGSGAISVALIATGHRNLRAAARRLQELPGVFAPLAVATHE